MFQVSRTEPVKLCGDRYVACFSPTYHDENMIQISNYHDSNMIQCPFPGPIPTFSP